ncbi:uncharacterized protein HaLaN_08581 [Haematococcus lacustris]|uniref:protein-tyrosine sulfotransferase n=1 Tax=Haematococcus lacustris TaxID=44745 RepID=A0A699YRL0_HAELA|nr:uncharacterized protein HaLaN_08581 [Haematococcus lacustris]
MLHNLWLVGHIQLLLPDACVVHVARHPLDAGLSCYAQPFASPGMAWSWDLGHIAAQINMTWRLAQHWEATLPGRMHTLLYEELVAHPELAARRLLAACGLDWAPQVLRFHTLDRPPAPLEQDILTLPEDALGEVVRMAFASAAEPFCLDIFIEGYSAIAFLMLNVTWH